MDDIGTTIAKIKAMREGGETERVHTLPHHGSYSVGKHSFDALSLLLLLHDNPSVDLIKAVLWHDIAERWIGDMPAPAKWANPRLNFEYEQAEVVINEKIGLGALYLNLNEDDRTWLDEVDRLEVMLWALDQLQLGNSNVAHFPAVIFDYFDAKPFVHHAVMMVVQNAQQRWRRLPDRLR